MIKLATVFSGIGAIEQAMIQKGMEYEIIFACDNGDIELNIDYDMEMKKIRNLNNVKEKREYVKNLLRTINLDTPGVKNRMFTAIQDGNLKGWMDKVGSTEESKLS